MMSIDRFIRRYCNIQGGHFFDTRTLEFFGESRDTMHVESELEEHATEAGNTYQCYVLVSVQHIPKLNPSYVGYSHIRQPEAFDQRICRTFFDVETMRDVGREYEETDARKGVL